MLKNEKEQLSIPLLEIIQAAQQGSVVHREGLQDLQQVHLRFTFNKYKVHRAHLDLVTTLQFARHRFSTILLTPLTSHMQCTKALCNFHLQLAMFDRAAFAKAEYLKWRLWL